MANERKTEKLPQMAQMRRKLRHGYPRIGEGIGVRRRRYQIHQWFGKHCAMRNVLDAQE